MVTPSRSQAEVRSRHSNSNSFGSGFELQYYSEIENISKFIPEQPERYLTTNMNPSNDSEDFFSSEFSDISFIKSFPIFNNDKKETEPSPFSNPPNSSYSDSPRSPLNLLSKSSTQSSEALEKDGDGKSYFEEFASNHDATTPVDYFPSTLSADRCSDARWRYNRLHSVETFDGNFENRDREDKSAKVEKQRGAENERVPDCDEIRGHVAMDKGDFKTAVEAYTEALKLTSNRTASLLSCRSSAYHKLGMHTQALKDAQTAVKLRPLWAKGYYRVGLAQNALGNKTATLYAFKQAITLDSEPNPKLYALCSKAESAMNKLAEAASLRNGKDSLCCVAFRPYFENFPSSSTETESEPIFKCDTPDQDAYVATGSVNGDVILWNSCTWKVCQVLSEHSGQITHLIWSKDGCILACVSMDLTISLWKRDPPKRFSQPGDSLTSFFEASRSTENKLLHLHWLLSGHSSLITSACFTEDSSCIVTASSDKTARLWDVATGVLLSVYNDHSSSLCRVVTSPNDELIASTSEDGTVIVRDLSTGECLHSIDCESGMMTSCQFISCSNFTEETKASVQFLAVCHVDGDSQEGSVLLFYLENGYIFECEDCVVKFNGQIETVEICHSEAEDGSLLVAISSSNGSVNLWNLRNGSFLLRLKAPGFKSQFDLSLSIVTSLTFSPCGRYLAGCAKDGRAYVWNVKTGDIVNVFLGGSNSWKNNLAWSSDSRYLSVGSGAQTIKIWRVDGNLFL